jgi:hypothetical protein
MDTGTEYQVEWGVYCENFVMIGLTAGAGDYFKNRASIPFAPCKVQKKSQNSRNQGFSYYFFLLIRRIRIRNTARKRFAATDKNLSIGV